MTEAVRLTSNGYWGRRSGTMTEQGGVFWQMQWRKTRAGNNNSKPKHYTRILVENAMSLGFYNGHRLSSNRR